jgi:hypothetical protein
MSSEGDERLHLSCKGSGRESELDLIPFETKVEIFNGDTKVHFATEFCSAKEV